MWRRLEDWGGVSNFYRPTPKFTDRKKYMYILFSIHTEAYIDFSEGGDQGKNLTLPAFSRRRRENFLGNFPQNCLKAPQKTGFSPDLTLFEMKIHAFFYKFS